MPIDQPQAEAVPTPDGALLLGRFEPIAELPDGERLCRDHLLERMVRVRTVEPGLAEALAGEARFIARLEHSGIPPVFDLMRGEGITLLVMRHLDGIRLSQAIEDARNGTVMPELADPIAVLRVMGKVCEALSAAHAHAVVHRAVTCQAIIIGLHGEVALTGWRAAMDAVKRPVTQRFLASRAAGPAHGPDDLHTDIRAVGRCLCEALTLEPCRDGLPAAAEARVAKPVLALIRRALDSDRVRGYRSMAELQADLARVAVQLATPQAPPARFSLARTTAVTALLLATIAIVIAITAWLSRTAERPAADPGWGAPIISEDFSDASWRSRWLPKSDQDWAVKDGRLVSTSPALALLICRQRLTPPIAIEYTGQMLPGGRPCDLSLTWTEGENALKTPELFGWDARTWRIQVGAYENQFCAIFTSQEERMAYNALQLVPGRDYRFRVEIEGEYMSMAIDGVEVMRYRDRMPTISGYLALYGFFPDKAFDDIRIWQKKRTGLVHATAMGDTLASFGHNQDAAVVYARLAEGGGPEAEQALFRKGVAERRLGRNDLARESWSRLTDPDLTQAADALRLEDIFDTGQHEIFLERLQSYWHRHPSGHDDLRHRWQQACKALVLKATTDPAVLERYLAVRETLFRDDLASAYEATAALNVLQRYEDIVRFFPTERKAYAKALLALGRLDEVERLAGLIPEDRWTMQRMRGDFAAMLKEVYLDPSTRAWILCKLGRIQEITSGPQLNFPAMLYQGKADQLLGMRPLSAEAAINALLITGRYAEGAGAGLPDVPHSERHWRAMVMLGQLEEAEKAGNTLVPWARLMRAAEAGERSTVAALRPQVGWPRNLSLYNAWFAGLVIGPMVDQVGGDAKALERSLQRAERELTQAFSKRAWFLALAALGKASDAEVLAMPVVSEGQAWLALGKALRAEIAGDGPAALLAYRTYAALPAQDRLLDENAPDVQVETFVQWRMRTLGR